MRWVASSITPLPTPHEVSLPQTKWLLFEQSCSDQFPYVTFVFVFKVQHGEELEQLKRDMAIVLQASLGAVPSPAKDDSNVKQLKQRIKELEEETEELSRKYNEELTTERVRRWRDLVAAENILLSNLYQCPRSHFKARESIE